MVKMYSHAQKDFQETQGSPPNPARRKRGKNYTIKISKLTGTPVISTRGKGLKITSEMVREMLADFP